MVRELPASVRLVTLRDSSSAAPARPRVAPSAWVAPGAVLAGDVALAAGASIWYGAVLRAETEPIEIGRHSNLQDGVIAHTDAGFVDL